MDFRCFLIEGDIVERLSDGWQMKVEEVRVNEIVCNSYNWKLDKHTSCTLKEGEFRLLLRTLDSRYSNY